MNKDLLNITLTIADRPYRLKVQPEDEEFVRRAGKLLENQIHEFQTQYHGKDKQDFLAMAAIANTTELLMKQGQSKANAAFDDSAFETLDQSLLDLEQVLNID